MKCYLTQQQSASVWLDFSVQVDGRRPSEPGAKLSRRSLVRKPGQSQDPSCEVFVEIVKTINNACASVALLNIVNNVPDIELGENLLAFKNFTASFSPALRGDAIGNFNFVRGIHNSFVR